MRAAIFYAPATDDPLWAAGSGWLGRDAATNIAQQQPSPKLACLTQIPARYGFHATLKPPMRLAGSLACLAADLAALAARMAPFDLPPLRVGMIGDMLALLLSTPSPALQELCDACVRDLDQHRRPADATEQARRRQTALSVREEALLARWGYPYVFDRWRFHMTLSSPLPARIQPDRISLARQYFAPSLALPRRVEALSLFIQPDDNASFHLARRFALEKPSDCL